MTSIDLCKYICGGHKMLTDAYIGEGVCQKCLHKHFDNHKFDLMVKICLKLQMIKIWQSFVSQFMGLLVCKSHFPIL